MEESQEFYFSKQYTQIATGINRLKYLKNKQQNSKFRINENASIIIHKLVMPPPTLLESQKLKTNAIKTPPFTDFKIQTKIGSRACKQNIFVKKQQTILTEQNKINLLRTYTSRNKIRNITKEHHLTHQNSPTQKETAFQFVNLGSAGGYRKEALSEQKRLNYTSMKSYRKELKELEQKKQEQHKAKILLLKNKVMKDKFIARRKAEEFYREKLFAIRNQKQMKRKKLQRKSQKQQQQWQRINESYDNQLEQYEQSLLLQDHIKRLIEQKLMKGDASRTIILDQYQSTQAQQEHQPCLDQKESQNSQFILT